MAQSWPTLAYSDGLAITLLSRRNFLEGLQIMYICKQEQYAEMAGNKASHQDYVFPYIFL